MKLIFHFSIQFLKSIFPFGNLFQKNQCVFQKRYEREREGERDRQREKTVVAAIDFAGTTAESKREREREREIFTFAVFVEDD